MKRIGSSRLRDFGEEWACVRFGIARGEKAPTWSWNRLLRDQLKPAGWGIKPPIDDECGTQVFFSSGDHANILPSRTTGLASLDQQVDKVASQPTCMSPTSTLAISSHMIVFTWLMVSTEADPSSSRSSTRISSWMNPETL